MNQNHPTSETHSLNNKKRLYTATFFLVFCFNFLMGCQFTSNAMYPLYIDHLGGGPVVLGIFMACFPISGVVGRPLIGVMIDRFGVKKIMMISSLCLCMPCLFFYWILDVGMTPFIWPLRVLQGFGWGAHMSAFFTFAAQEAPPGRRNEAIAMYGLSGLSSNAVAPYLSEKIIQHYGFAPFFLLMTGVGLLAFFLISIIHAPHEAGDRGDSDFTSMIQLFKVPGFGFVIFLSFALAVAYSTMANFLAPLAKERAISDFGLYFTAYSIFGVIIRIFGSRWGDRIGLYRISIPALAMYGGGLVVLFFSESLLGVILAGGLCGMGHGLGFPAITSLGYNIAPKLYRGRAMALVTGVMDAGNAINAYMLGYLAKFFGFGPIFLVGAILPFTAVVMLVGKQKQKSITST